MTEVSILVYYVKHIQCFSYFSLSLSLSDDDIPPSSLKPQTLKRPIKPIRIPKTIRSRN